MNRPRTNYRDMQALEDAARTMQSKRLEDLLADHNGILILLREVLNKATDKNAVSPWLYIETCEWLETQPDEEILGRLCAANKAQEPTT